MSAALEAAATTLTQAQEIRPTLAELRGRLDEHGTPTERLLIASLEQALCACETLARAVLEERAS